MVRKTKYNVVLPPKTGLLLSTVKCEVFLSFAPLLISLSKAPLFTASFLPSFGGSVLAR